jgi:hypothetical protein
VYNIATLIGPTKSPASTPNVVFTTQKHLPIPIIESYSSLTRTDRILGSSPDHLPLSRIELAHHSKTPSPKLTPFQTIDVSASICFDIVQPNLMSSFILPSSLSPSSDLPRSPNLILSAASSPSLFAPLLIENAISRAQETSSFILHCDTTSEGGTSALIDPQGQILDLKKGIGLGSWETEIDLSRSGGGGKMRDWIVWMLLIGFTVGSTVNVRLLVARRKVGEVVHETLIEF